MTRIDLTTRELHELVVPVIPHASTDADLPELNVVRIETSGDVLYAAAADRFTLGASRHRLDDPADDTTILIDRADAAAMLRLFTYNKDEDPKLSLVVDTVPVPVGRDETATGRGLRVDSDDGTRLVLHDRTMLGRTTVLDNWRKLLGRAVHRAIAPAAPALLLNPSLMARWAKAAGKGERITFLAGPEPADPILILVEDHFAGAWMPYGHLDSADGGINDNPWRAELPVPEPSDEPDPDEDPDD